MAAILVMAGVGVVAAFAATVLAVLIIGIRRGDRHHLADKPRSVSDAFARRLLVGVRYPDSTTEFTGEETEDSE
jgi:predicted RND superfamily exporter protein